MKPLAPLPGHQFSQAWGVNERGQVVGQSLGCDPDSGCVIRPVIWYGAAVFDIGGIEGASFHQPREINSRGDMVGTASIDETFVNRGYLVEPH